MLSYRVHSVERWNGREKGNAHGRDSQKGERGCSVWTRGLRVSELICLGRADVVLGTGAHLRRDGKRRKERCTPLRQEVVAVLNSKF